ncbi:NADH:flavin oxidoreductase [Acidocella sp.]|uniref:NADH:flavin oxidoreductase n=1 Tax=Acidocella sp. TaxID=50710 RepID=UPI00260EB36C|nr:NADH:flavin oxidoreductase [Acidocella sp.]
MSLLSTPLPLKRGPALKNRFLLAPMTNLQSHADGVLSDDEYRWLTMRAAGGFGLTMTCAASVQSIGQGFPGQLGAHADLHLPGLTRLATALRAAGSVSALQLHHAGIRAERSLVPEPVGPSADEATGARALSLPEVEQLRDDFIAAAIRAERAGFDGVEIHGAHGYVLAQFLSAELNHRTDRYGGSLENRARLLLEVVTGIRAAAGLAFQLGLRLSPERFGMRLGEMIDLITELLRGGALDYLDLSLWDVFKVPDEEEFSSRSLLSYFTALPRHDVRICGAGKILSGADAARALDEGCDFVAIGRAAILNHDFPELVLGDLSFQAPPLPVSPAHLQAQGVGPAFLDYLRGWRGFVAA